MTRPAGMTLRWVAVAALVAVAWLIGLVVWGSPETGTVFGDVGSWWSPLSVLIPGVPAFVVSGRALGSPTWHRLGLAALVISTLGTMYLVQFAHFGGICLDPGDVCDVEWDSRVAALVAGLAAAGVGFTAEALTAKVRRNRDSSTAS